MAEKLRELMLAEQPPVMPIHRLMLGVRNVAEARRRRRRARLGATGVAVVVLYAVGSAVVPGHNLPGVAAGLVQTGTLTCGSVPRSSGPKAGRLTATLQGPPSGQTGLSVNLQMTLHSTDGQRVSVSTGPPSTLVVRDGYVVGKTPDDSDMPAIAFEAVAPGSQTIPTGVLLSGCPHASKGPIRPVQSRRPLPPGRYDLVAVITETPGTTAGEVSVIVSAPTTIHVTEGADKHAQ